MTSSTAVSKSQAWVEPSTMFQDSNKSSFHNELTKVKDWLKLWQNEMESMIKKLHFGQTEEKSPSPKKKWKKKKKAIYNTKVKKKQKKSNYEYFIWRAKETHHVPTKQIESGGRFYE